MKLKKMINVLGVTLLLFSCQAGKELHYFTSGKNYYKLTIREGSYFSSSRYVSGYFDERALDLFFDEIHSEDSLRSPNQYQVQFLNDEGEPVNPANTKLVMLMSTESSTVSRRISSLAQSEETLQTMARLANQDKIGENVLLNSQCNQIDSMAVGLASAGEKFIVEKISVDNGGLDSTSANQLRILSFLNYAAALKGSKEPYQTIDDALEMLKK